MKFKMTIEVQLEDNLWEPLDEDMKMWIENEILIGDGSLILTSNMVGDSIGIIKSVKNIQYIN